MHGTDRRKDKRTLDVQVLLRVEIKNEKMTTNGAYSL